MKTEYDIIIVGAGPAGSIAARTAARAGVSVLLLEKDREVGYPVRCGEAISKAGVEEFIDPDPGWIAATISRFSFNAPDGTEVIIDFGEAGYVLDRRVFDYELSRTAVNAGAEVKTSAYVNGLLFDDGKVGGVKF
jgi:digeranylgeranylglycerophospholipid reductase